MPLWIDCVAVDCRDPRPLAEFWRRALDYEVEYSSYDDPEAGPDADPEVVIAPRDRRKARLGFFAVPEGKTVKNRLHLDLRSRDQAGEVARLESMGARRIDIGQGDVTWVVMADPEGNEFCVLRDPTAEEAEDLFYG